MEERGRRNSGALKLTFKAHPTSKGILNISPLELTFTKTKRGNENNLKILYSISTRQIDFSSVYELLCPPFEPVSLIMTI